MRSLIRITLIAALSLPLAAFGQTTSASGATPGGGSAPAPAGPVPTKVGVMNIDRIIEETNDGKRDFADLQKKYEAKDTELKNAAGELQTLQKQMETQGPKMNEDARVALQKQIDQKQRALQQNVDSARADFQADQNEVAQRILKKLEPVVKKYAVDNGYAIILDASRQTTWAAPQADISDAIIAAYNAANPGAAPPPSTVRPSRPPASGTTTQPRPPAAGTTATQPKPTGTTTPH